MKTAAIVALCLTLQGCVGFAHNYIAKHPDGMSALVPDCCCGESS
ncbi:hypothetical protein VOM14_05840 [Paraburkholderia sp. MPAMCS5]|nr:hypothetical protein [Paraburkholderia sp. MPAMCS5]